MVKVWLSLGARTALLHVKKHIMVWVRITASVRLVDLCCHGSNKHLFTAGERLR